MLIRIGYDIRFELTQDVPFLALVRVHPSRQADLRSSDLIRTDVYTRVEEYLDTFGNACSRFLARSGPHCLGARAIIEDAGQPDPACPDAPEIPLPNLLALPW